jgi:hypothetical protein
VLCPLDAEIYQALRDLAAGVRRRPGSLTGLPISELEGGSVVAARLKWTSLVADIPV